MRRLALILIAVMSSVVFADTATKIDPYFQISQVTVEAVVSSSQPTTISKDLGTDIGEVISITRQIIAFGKEVYKIVEAGKPVINTKYAPISVLPVNTEFGESITATDLARWQMPKSQKFKVTYKNGYGAEVVAFTYNVNMSAGGQFQGKGAYITNAQIVPENVAVAWGYNFNAEMSLVGLTNLGSDDEPVAGATLKLHYTVSTLVKEERNNMTIFIAGDGSIQQM